MNFIRRPESFDVVVALQPLRRHPERYFRDYGRQHGPCAQRQSRSHPPLSLDVRTRARLRSRYRGKGIVNPLATFFSGAQMLEHLGLATEAKRLNDTIAMVLSDPANHTPDLGGKASTGQVEAAVLAFAPLTVICRSLYTKFVKLLRHPAWL